MRSFNDAVLLSNVRPLSDLEKQGLIQSFEFCHELAWNVVKDYLEFQGNTGILGSRDAMREAFQKGFISNGSDWMDMIKSRNLSSHTYNKKIAEDIVNQILNTYAPRFNELEAFFKNLT